MNAILENPENQPDPEQEWIVDLVLIDLYEADMETHCKRAVFIERRGDNIRLVHDPDISPHFEHGTYPYFIDDVRGHFEEKEPEKELIFNI